MSYFLDWSNCSTINCLKSWLAATLIPAYAVLFPQYLYYKSSQYRGERWLSLPCTAENEVFCLPSTLWLPWRRVQQSCLSATITLAILWSFSFTRGLPSVAPFSLSTVLVSLYCSCVASRHQKPRWYWMAASAQRGQRGRHTFVDADKNDYCFRVRDFCLSSAHYGDCFPWRRKFHMFFLTLKLQSFGATLLASILIKKDNWL